LFRECAPPEWLGTSHMSFFGAYWEHAYLKEIPNFGKEDLVLEHTQQVERKKHAKTEGKTTCKRKIHVARRKTILTMIGLVFLLRIVMDIILQNSINKYLGGLE
jgi:hypothetical protein